MYYLGLLLLAVGSVGLTLLSYFSVFGVPIFILGVVLVMISKGKTLKNRLIPVGGFIIGIFSFWSIWISLQTLDTEVF